MGDVGPQTLGFTKVSESPELKAHGLESLRKELLGHAKNFYEHFVYDQPQDRQVRVEQGQNCLSLARITSELGELDESRYHALKANEIFERLGAENPNDAECLDGLATSLSMSAKYRAGSRQAAECRQAFERGVQIRRYLLEKSPDQPEQIFKLASDLIGLGRFYHWESGQKDRAEFTLLESLSLCEQLVKQHPDTPEYQHEMAHVLQNLGQIHVPRGDHQVSLSYAERALPLLEKLANDHPAAPEYQRRLVQTLAAIEVAHHNLREPEKGLEVHERARKTAEELAKIHPDVPEFESVLSQLQVPYGGAFSQLGQYAKAVEAVEAALQKESCRDVLYNAAFTYALAAASVQKDGQLDAEQREQRMTHYTDRAMELLVKAECVG